MAATLETKNYKLPIFSENDTTDWDAYNNSMQTIDTEMAANKTAGDANLDSIKDMQESLNNTTALVNGYESRIESLESTATANTNSIASINRTDQSQNARLDAIESELNDLPNVTTDITELQTQVAEIKVKNNSQDTEIGKNSTAITVNANQISGLRTDLNSLDDRVVSLETGTNTQQSYVARDIVSISVQQQGTLYIWFIYSNGLLMMNIINNNGIEISIPNTEISIPPDFRRYINIGDTFHFTDIYNGNENGSDLTITGNFNLDFYVQTSTSPYVPANSTRMFYLSKNNN